MTRTAKLQKRKEVKGAIKDDIIEHDWLVGFSMRVSVETMIWRQVYAAEWTFGGFPSGSAKVGAAGNQSKE